MTTEIYADTLFIVNFSMDFLSLFITGKLTHSPIKSRRILLAAALGAIFATVSVVFDSGDAVSRILWLTAFATCALTMCRISYSVGLKKLLPVFIAVNLGLGGLMSLLFGLARRSGLTMSGGDNSASPLMFLVFALISGVVSLVYGRLRMFGTKRKEVTSQITVLGNTVSARLLSDSGNLLCDPISSKPVIILSPDIFGDKIPETIKSGDPDYSTLEFETGTKLRLIPALADGSYDGCDGIVPEILVN